jgi:hypothetical protein
VARKKTEDAEKEEAEDIKGFYLRVDLGDVIEMVPGSVGFELCGVGVDVCG